MPDISMCPSTTCPARTACYRNEASGTVPSGTRQAWMDWPAMRDPDGACPGWSPVRQPDDEAA